MSGGGLGGAITGAGILGWVRRALRPATAATTATTEKSEKPAEAEKDQGDRTP